MSKKILHEPLVHFVLAGVFIFILYSLLEPGSAGDDEIIVDMATIERFSVEWSRRMNRAPTPEELEGLLADYIFEELLSREARSLGLAQDDPIIRRRLVQKMELLAESAAQQVQPADAELLEWYEAHPELYRSDPRLGFKHIYFSHDRRDTSAQKDAAALLPRLAGLDENAGQPGLGDSFMLPHEFTDISRSQLDRLFGGDFAAALLELEPGSWQGPARSGYGYHLVFLFEVRDAAPIPFSESRTRVMQDWQRDRYEQVKQQMLEELKNRYEISYTEEAQSLLSGK